MSAAALMQASSIFLALASASVIHMLPSMTAFARLGDQCKMYRASAIRSAFGFAFQSCCAFTAASQIFCCEVLASCISCHERRVIRFLVICLCPPWALVVQRRRLGDKRDSFEIGPAIFAIESVA